MSPAEAAARSWILVYTRAGSRLAWLAIDDVPGTVKRAEVMDALESWRRWPAYAPGPAGRLSLVPAERAGNLAGERPPAVISWGQLAPESVRTTLELAGDVHARIVQASRRRGLSQAAWMAVVVDEAARAELEGVAP